MLQLSNVRSDGSVDDAATVDVVIRHPHTGEPTGMVATVTLAATDEFYKLCRKFRRTERDPVSRQMQQNVDGVKVQQAMLEAHVKSWSGLNGADGKPLPCQASVLAALPEWIRDQMTEAIRGIPVDPSPAEVRDESFREPA